MSLNPIAPAPSAGRPLIGISAERAVQQTRVGGARDLDFSPIGYQHSIYAAGGLPVILPVVTPETAPELIARLDGLVLQGGEDVSPELYGGSPQPDHDHSMLRDEVEMALIRAAREQHKPLLAICRGIQLFNVLTGGTLVEDITASSTHPAADSPQSQEELRHEVVINPGSRLASIIGESTIVNTFHHQAIAKTGELAVTAYAPDGVIEAAELPEPAAAGWWNLAVQWHPERLAAFESDRASRAIFAALIAAAQAHTRLPI